MMKLSVISGVLSIVTTTIGLTVTVQAAISPTLESSNLLNGANQTLAVANSLEQSIHNQVNQYRQSKNLPPLVFDQTIIDQARLHSLAMANVGKISHNGFDNRVTEIGKTIPYSSVAENVAANQGYKNPENTAVEGWITSPRHQKNMVGDFNLTGIGVVEKGGRYYFTQIFVSKK
jgi:uncharacterized protein YkwD